MSTEFKRIVSIGKEQVLGHRSVFSGLLQVYGLGRYLTRYVINRFNISGRMGDIPKETLQEVIDYIRNGLSDELPVWLRNYTYTRATGESVHLLEDTLRMEQTQSINALKTIKNYRGQYHSLNRKVKGQRTRSNGRRGRAVGVGKK